PPPARPGLVPGARLVAVDAFHRAGADERADVFTLIASLGFLADAGVRVINLSLAGPENGALAETVERLTTTQDIVVISAAGNGGPSADPAYPAAYEQVVAVTAVDREGEIYRRAVRGAHLDLAAPGVDVWTAASVSGARWKTGTSFAVPFVTAAAAILREARPELTAAEIAQDLRRRAQDLGDPGPDEVFGAGLLSLGALCDEQAPRMSQGDAQ
ncbi:protease, partial [Cereibacter changlensis]